ncbi:MAG: PAS domain S-box protein [Bacteroidota bacterium]|nr:PAS domain S-box protein [Bacteroidota bacterium]
MGKKTAASLPPPQISETVASTNSSTPNPRRKNPTKPKQKGPQESMAKSASDESQFAIETLRKSESTLRALIENAKDAFILFSREGKVLAFNQVAVNLYRKQNKREITEGSSIYDLVIPSRHEDTRKIFDRVLTGQTFERIVNHISDDGKKYSFKRFFNPVTSEDGSVYAIANTISDITAEVEAAEAIRNSEANLRALFDNAQHGFALIDRSAKILAFNKMFDDIFSLASAKRPMVGSSLFDLLREEHIPIMRETVAQVLTGKVFDRTTPLQKPDGSIFWARGSYSPVKDNSGNIIGVCIGTTDVTKEIGAQAAIRESEANLRALFDNTKEGFVLIDLNSTILAFNHAAGYLYEEVIGKTLTVGKGVSEVLGRQLGEYMRTAFDTVLAGGSIERTSKQTATDGKTYWLRGNYNAVRSSEGAIIGICIGISDISAEVEAGAYVSQLAAIVESSNDAIIGKTLEGIVTSWNFGAEKIFGYTAKEMLGRSITTLIPRERLEEEQQILEKISRGEKIEQFTTTRITRSGEQLIVSVTISPIRNRDGVIIGASKIARDITEQNRLNNKIRESEKRFRTVADTAPILIWMSDESDHVDFLNTGWVDFTGRSMKELLSDWNSCIHPDDRPGRNAVRAEAYSEKKEFSFEYRIRRHDGEYRWVAGNGRPRFSFDGTFLGFIGTCTDITERKMAREELEKEVNERTFALRTANHELREQKEFMETVLDSSIDQICVYDKAGRFITANRKFREESDKDLSELTGKTFLEVYPELEHSVIYQGLKKALAGEPSSAPWRSPQSGRNYTISFITPERNNESYGVMVSAHDITDILQAADQIQQFNTVLEAKNTVLQQTNAELQQQKEFIETMLDASIDQIVVCDKDLRLLAWNKKCEEHFGLKKEDVIGKTYEELFPDFVGAQGYSDIREVLRTGEIRYRSPRKSPLSDRIFEAFIVPLKHNKEVYATLTISHDVTEIISISEKLRQTNEMLERQNDELLRQNDLIQTMIDSSVDFISVYDKDLRLISLNKRALDSLNVKKEQIIGKTFPEINRSTDAAEETMKDIRKALAGEYVHRVNGRTEETFGRDYEIFFIPLVHNNEVYAALIMAHDITDIMNISEKLRKANALLGEKNMELERSNTELERFAYAASHDLQEPLRKIRMFAGRLREHGGSIVDEVSQNYFAKIDHSSDRMSNLIKDILNYSRLNSAADKFELTDLNEVVSQALADFDLVIEEKKAKIRIDKLPEIECLQIQLVQLFHNLFSNSLKFSRPGVHPEIHVSSRTLVPTEIAERKLDRTNSYCEIILTDNGIGFDQEFAEKIFVIFQRLNERNKYEGTGIGLALCRKIAEKHKGIIYALSTEGKGSEFHIILPFKQMPEKDNN